jgi:hypothetical protein
MGPLTRSEVGYSTMLENLCKLLINLELVAAENSRTFRGVGGRRLGGWLGLSLRIDEQNLRCKEDGA